MPFIYSTASNDTDFCLYEKTANDAARIVKRVRIAGKANIASKNLITPYGVRTEVSDRDLEFLLANQNFQKICKAGFMCVREEKIEPEIVAADMEKRDDSAPRVPQDFEKDKDGVTPVENMLKQVVNKLKG